MAEINDRLENDESFRAELESSSAKYLATRDSISVLSDRNHPGGGPEHVKCLHAHTAHQLMTGDNPVGRQVIEAIQWSDPDEHCV